MWFDTCEIPTTNIVDFDFANSPAVLDSSGMVHGYTSTADCIDEDMPPGTFDLGPGAFELAFHEYAACVLVDSGEIDCRAFDETA